ncbi:MAG: type II glyceraldehyde-3-phosphate dehydrogenase, partial [Desulfurococcales archaeon]|nr:type II glyceraldehyde-3-phosphate dehydrogenase [Desulfurococcales archaeon]
VPEESMRKFEEADIPVAGRDSELIDKVDVVIDATPAKVGLKNKNRYDKAGVKQIFQGGEPASICEVSFNALTNYDAAVGKKCVRVVSCNTTGLARVIYALRKLGTLRKVRGVIVRRGADLKEVKKGPIEGLLLKPTSPPSHHAEDVKTVVGDLDIITYAVVAPTTLAHMHVINAVLDRAGRREDVLEALKSTTRIMLVRGELLSSTAELREYAKESIRPGGDIYENVVWEDSVWVEGNEVMLAYAVHQEAIVVPENIDAVRALTGLADRDKSINLTNTTLGIGGAPD